MFVSGDIQTREVAAYQPLKFAAMEGVCKTGTNVELAIFGLPPSQDCSTAAETLAVPDGLSLMMNLNPNSQINGLDQQPDQSLWPPVAVPFLGFHTMVGIGALMLLLMALGALFLWRRSVEIHRWWLKLAVLAIPVPILAIEIGWMVAEVGRQPWIVYGLMKTSAGVSPGVSGTDVAISLIADHRALRILFFRCGCTRCAKEISRGPRAGTG